MRRLLTGLLRGFHFRLHIPAVSAMGGDVEDEIIRELARILAAGYLRLQKIRQIPELPRARSDARLAVAPEESVHGGDGLTRGDNGDGGSN